MKKLICFDFDGTLTDASSWYLFNTHFGMTPEEDASLFQQYLQNGFDYNNWIAQIVTILKERNRLNKASLETFVSSIPLREGASALVDACNSSGYTPVIISGGLKQVVEHVAGTLGVDRVFTTSELVFHEDGSFDTIVDSGDEMYAKLQLFESVCEEYGVAPADTIAVGDGGNDIEIFKQTKKGILVGTYEKLREHAWKQVDSLRDIQELL